MRPRSGDEAESATITAARQLAEEAQLARRVHPTRRDRRAARTVDAPTSGRHRLEPPTRPEPDRQEM